MTRCASETTEYRRVLRASSRSASCRAWSTARDPVRRRRCASQDEPRAPTWPRRRTAPARFQLAAARGAAGGRGPGTADGRGRPQSSLLALRNVVTNAIEWSPLAAPAARRGADEGVEILVDDSGPGVPSTSGRTCPSPSSAGRRPRPAWVSIGRPTRSAIEAHGGTIEVGEGPRRSAPASCPAAQRALRDRPLRPDPVYYRIAIHPHTGPGVWNNWDVLVPPGASLGRGVGRQQP